MRTHRNFASDRRSGRFEVVIGFIFALVICGAAVWLLLRSDDPGPETTRPSAKDPLARADVEPPRTKTGTPSGESQKGSADAEGKSEADVDSDAVVAAKTTVERYVTGKVTDTDGQALAEAFVRWIGVDKKDLERYGNDARALGQKGDVKRFWRPGLRTAFEKSLTASTDTQGSYRIDLPSTGSLGCVVVVQSGFEMRIHEVAGNQVVDDASPSDAEEASEEDAEDASEEDAAADEEDAELVTPADGSPVEFALDFRLAPASSISGQVVDADSGEPAEGVVVRAGQVDKDALTVFTSFSKGNFAAVSGPDGSYEIQGFAPGEYRVLARSGYSEYVSMLAKEGLDVVVEKGTDVTGVDLKVRLGGRITGVVRDPEGELVEGAKCSIVALNAVAEAMSGSVERMQLFNGLRDRSDKDGKFEFAGLAPNEKYGVTAEKEGFALARSSTITLNAEQREAEVELELAEGWSISGRVLHADGKPAAFLEVRDRLDFAALLTGDFDDSYRGEVETTTDREGEFELKDLPAGEYRLTTGKMRPEEFFAESRDGTEVVLDGMSDVEGVEIVLKAQEESQQSGVAGVVVDDRGEPLEKVKVRVTSLADWTGLLGNNAVTDPEGRFSIPKLRAGTYRVIATMEGYADGKIDALVVPGGEARLVMARNAAVSGRVLLRAGGPAPSGTKVRARPAKENSLDRLMKQVSRQALGAAGPAAVTADAEGRFTMEVDPGEIEIVASVPGHAQGVSAALKLQPGEDRSGVDIVVSVGSIVHGRVVDVEGSAIAGATVLLHPILEDGATDQLAQWMPELFAKLGNRATTNADGEFEIAHLRSGSYRVVADHKEFAPADPQDVRGGDDRVHKTRDLLLLRGSRIVGRVFDVEGDVGKPGMLVQLIGAGGMERGFSSNDGTFEFKGIREGEYAMTVMDMAAMQKQKFIMKNVAVVVEKGSDVEVEVPFGKGKRVFGEVTGLTPGAMRAITLRVPGGLDPEEMDYLDPKAQVEATKYQKGVTIVVKDGPYEISDIEPGKYILEMLNLPQNYSDPEAIKNMNKTPLFRKEVTVREDGDLKLDIKVATTR